MGLIEAKKDLKLRFEILPRFGEKIIKQIKERKGSVGRSAGLKSFR